MYYYLQALSSKQLIYLHFLLIPMRKCFKLRSSSSDLLFISKVNSSIGTRTFPVAPTLWNMLLSNVKSVENIVNFRRYLETYHLFIDSEIDQPVCIDAPVMLVSKDSNAMEVI